MSQTRLETLGFNPIEFASAIFEHSDLAIFLIHVHGPKIFTYTGLNPTHERLTGLQSEIIKDKHPHDFLSPEIADIIVEHYEECRQKKTTISYEETIPFEGKDTFWVTRLIPLLNQENVVTHIIGASINIDDRKDLENRLLQLVEFNQTIIDISQMGILIFDRDGYCLSINETAQTIFGITHREEISNYTVEDFHHLHHKKWEELCTHKHTFPEVHFINKKGEEKWVFLQTFPYQHMGKTLLIMSVTDITTLKLQQYELEEKNHFISTLLQHLPYPLAAFREDMTLCFHNEEFAREFAFLHPKNGITTIPAIREALGIPQEQLYPFRKGHETIEISLKKRKKHYLIEQYRIGEITSQSCRIIWTFSNITSHKRLIHKLEKDLHHDFLTGLYNRRGIENILPLEWRRAQRDKLSLSILMADIDFFKNYNDSLGHTKGDKCLKEVANILKESCYRPGDFVFRYGGEEFLILLTNTSSDGALVVAQRIQLNLKKKNIPHPTSSVASHVTLSIGIASFTPSEISWQKAITIADKALYQAKQKGRNAIAVFTPPESKNSSDSFFR